jgi:hypothetical protein
LEIEPVDHAAAGNHVLDAALLDAIVHHFGSDRVVQIHADAAIEPQHRVRDDSSGRRRQQHAHVSLVVAEHLPQNPPQNQRTDQEFAAGEFDAGGIGDFSSVPIPAAHPQEFPRHGQPI